MQPEPQPSLIARKLLARNAMWNLAGQLVPLAVGLVAIPLLITGLGVDRFGILTLVWVVIGYFGIFDFGLGRAMTKLVSDRLGATPQLSAGSAPGVRDIVRPTIGLVFGLGVVGMLILAAIAPWLIHHVLNVPSTLTGEALPALYVLAVSVPLVTATVAMRGLLEAFQQFGVINAVRVPLATFTFVGPLLVLPFSNSLVAIVTTLLCGRIIACFAYWYFARRVPGYRTQPTGSLEMPLRTLLTFGGWMTISNLVGPLMVYLDRLLIAGMLTLAAVTYYATPYEVVSRLTFIPAGLIAVLFPALALSLAHDPKETLKILQRGFDAIMALMAPLIALICVAAEPGLRIWAGNEIATEGASVMQVLAIGIFLNSLGYLTVAQVQAAGRPDLIAKIHLAELAPYLFVLWWLIESVGIQGAAIAWTLRAGIDLLATTVIVDRLIPQVRSVLVRSAWLTLFCLALFIAGMLAPIYDEVASFGVIATVSFAGVAWKYLIQRSDKALIRNWISRTRTP